MNNVVLLGRLTKIPELRYTPGKGTAVTTFVLAIERYYKKEGQPEADFVAVVTWGKQAENCANYLVKGQLAAVKGRLQTRTYTDTSGNKRYITEVVAEEVKFLSKPNNNAGSNENSTDNGVWQQQEGFTDDMVPVDDGDMPF